MAKKELWKNLGKGDVWVKTFDVKGNEVAKKVPGSGGTIQVTSEERKMNQEIAYGPEADVFTNGKLIVSDFTALVDVAEDLEELRSNSLSESEIQKLLTENTNVLKKKLTEINEPAIISALKDLVEDNDDVSTAKAKAIHARYDEIMPPTTRQQFEDFENSDSVKPRKL